MTRISKQVTRYIKILLCFFELPKQAALVLPLLTPLCTLLLPLLLAHSIYPQDDFSTSNT